MCNMINATINNNSNTSTENSLQIIGMVEKLFEEFNKNIEYVTQPFEDSILGSKPINIENSNTNRLKESFDELIVRLDTIQDEVVSKNKVNKRKDKESDESLKIRSLSDSLQSINEEVTSVNNEKNLKLDAKKSYQGEMQNNLRNGKLFWV